MYEAIKPLISCKTSSLLFVEVNKIFHYIYKFSSRFFTGINKSHKKKLAINYICTETLNITIHTKCYPIKLIMFEIINN